MWQAVRLVTAKAFKKNITRCHQQCQLEWRVSDNSPSVNMSSCAPAVKTALASKFSPTEQRNPALNPPSVPPFVEGYDPRERQVPRPAAEKDVWHKGETLSARTFCRSDDRECELSRAMANVLWFREGAIRHSSNRLASKITVDRTAKNQKTSLAQATGSTHIALRPE